MQFKKQQTEKKLLSVIQPKSFLKCLKLNPESKISLKMFVILLHGRMIWKKNNSSEISTRKNVVRVHPG